MSNVVIYHHCKISLNTLTVSKFKSIYVLKQEDANPRYIPSHNENLDAIRITSWFLIVTPI